MSVVHDWVNKGLGISRRVGVTGHTKDPCHLLKRVEHRVPVVGFLLVHRVIIITGLNKLYDGMFSLDAGLDSKIKPYQIVTKDFFSTVVQFYNLCTISPPGEEEGWQEGDVSKTVVVPGTTSFLLTSYLNESHIEGAAVVLTRDAIYRPPNAWFVVDLGVHSGAPQWTMKEAECGYQLTPIGSIRSRSQFELDIDDSLTAALVINTTGQ